MRESVHEIDSERMRRRVRSGYWIASLVLAALVVGLAACTAGAPFYLVRQGMGQARILLSRTPVEAALNDGSLSEQQKQRLLHMRAVRAFAREDLGLKDTESFASVVLLRKGQAVSYVVSAAPEFSLSPKTWWFPIVGDVPYLGFFDREHAAVFESYLRANGYDTDLGEVAAYSTIGWFSDPVFTSQLDRSEAYLTGLVIHEMVHSTIWVKGRADFNEALASYVEEQGRLAFYRKHEGPESRTVRRIQDFQAEERRYDAMLDDTEKSLRDLYASGLSVEEKRRQRSRLYDDLRNRLEAARSSFRLLDPGARSIWNNARFATRSVYRPTWPGFDLTLRECQGELRCFMERYAVYAQSPDRYPERFQAAARGEN